MTKNDFRMKLVELMREKNITIAKLSRHADLNYSTVYNFIMGKSQMKSNNLEKLFDILEKL